MARALARRHVRGEQRVTQEHQSWLRNSLEHVEDRIPHDISYTAGMGLQPVRPGPFVNGNVVLRMPHQHAM